MLHPSLRQQRGVDKAERIGGESIAGCAVFQSKQLTPDLQAKLSPLFS
jgi:hypothetical protein